MSSSLTSYPALFVSIPHSGTQIPAEANWLKNLPPPVLNCDVDAFVDDLYAPVLKKRAIPAVIFPWHRYSVDMNRWAWDISPKTVQRAGELLKTLYKHKNSLQKNSSGASLSGASLSGASPSGTSPSNVHWHKTTKGDLLIKEPLSQNRHKVLIKKYFEPYHQQIQNQLRIFKKQGAKKIYFLDLHSMPSKALAYHKDYGELRTEIVIGNNRGRSASPAFTELAIKAYRQAGFKVALNWPYSGGAISRFYGQPQKGQEALQVELNRKLYMDEKTHKKNQNYKNIQLKLALAISYIKQRLPLPSFPP